MLRFSPIRAADLRAYTQLATDATLAVTNLLENMHHNVSRLPGVFGEATEEPARGITGFVYRSIRGVTRTVGSGVDNILRVVAPQTLPEDVSLQREILISVLNGVVGDYLVSTNNPLQIAMQLRRDGIPLQLEREALSATIPAATGKILVLAHGLCMSDLQWRRRGHDHGQQLADELGYTPVYLHYNSGLHISTNGHEFSQNLEALIAAWPVAVEQLVIVGYSMGGLVARSACEDARRTGKSWIQHLRDLVFVGTPHDGSPLERSGNRLDTILGSSPYTVALSRLGKLRSAGITDLRHASLDDAEWQDHDRFRDQVRRNEALPLPRDVRCYAIAGSLGKKPGALSERLAGDGLVPLYSALGLHRNPKRNLKLPESRRKVIYKTNHLDLLGSQEAYAHISAWLGALEKPGRIARESEAHLPAKIDQ
ncbi:MAG TPA: alpha/beta hydrolase [Dokdonella sp.]|uniref:lipase family alpha/beta hydrolase n=1 Tax=Dokdonella sp. TaxID=2291710 RepID=UPI002D7F78B0|nr:alpha/beta hydrolase [Dokdonella sp.]HET9033899.1 alpha/beta hydrolase [Dokdonella sp.]